MAKPNPASAMRRAAAQLRKDAAAMREYIATDRFYLGATDDPDERYRRGVTGGLGGPGGDYAARFIPGFADLLAASWDALGAEMADYPAVHVKGGIGLSVYPDQPSKVWTSAYNAAAAYLAEARKETRDV